uniref:Microtubule-associated protein tau n=1 Tax=Anthurium amnicola TaxID=1678845 RepID=A0A1D1XZ89_9ARAE
MEGKKQPAPSSPPASSSSSIADDLFGRKDEPSPSSNIFHALFPPAPTVLGKDSSRSDIFRPSEKQEAQNQKQDAHYVAKVVSTSKSMYTEGTSEGDEYTKENTSYRQVKSEPCFLSSSVLYGGQDFCYNVSSVHDYDHKKDGEDDSDDPNAACRGNWWQGSLYY